ncbi:hypothetical protein HH214_14270 [Mucilaginibacter robiniae]|uniref:Glycosyltransferase subfamily 4-like N-terminal domain-containing protein n=1 Tax=Mucilaginibacter robiniae TaxID=2728022 RepID=A0A7L5E0Q2_9SPHI|nr:glycosyltransferase [Mucilaginibacter robiniae]QJD96950.1 hypothetical protein HH214_14270 [Mucilaginibacter robiniae]
MRIAFLCGALEPGRDGVGDYTRRLAGELARNGHELILISLNDKYIAAEFNGVQDADGTMLQVRRVPGHTPLPKALNLVKAWLQAFNPEWVSLQFVPYSFHPKGLPFGFFRKLKAVATQAKWHVMFHEIWLDKPERAAQQLVMHAQKLIIYMGLAQLKPKLVTVTLPYNQARLQAIGIQAEISGLFGNIDKSSTEQLPACFSKAAAYSEKVLYFGGPPRGTFLRQVLDGLEQFCKSHLGKVSIVIVREGSAEKQQFIETLNKRLGLYGAAVIDCGFLEPNELSTVLSNCTVGVVRSEPYLIGKSGAAIAMLEHGTPLWLPKWDGKAPADYHFRSHLIFSELQEANAYPAQSEYQPLLPEIAEKFITQLNNR